MNCTRRRLTCQFMGTFLCLSLVVIGLGNEAIGSPRPLPEQKIIELEKEIHALMQDQIIPGLAVAVVDKQNILWYRGFGVSNFQERHPIDVDTLFSIQSMSKTVTATAIMLAVQEGLLDLDAPITTYLPYLQLNSVFENQPEQKMTLRHLLSHTAGFTHEAPIGNNFNLDPGTFEEHIQSISRTWLRFPVGENYAYSNLGIDLAAYILQTKSGIPFEQYVRIKLFEPLGMFETTLDPNIILQSKNRATGHEMIFSHIPIRVPMLAAGGVYTNAADLSKFVRFFLNQGRVGSQQILGETQINAMYAVPLFAHGRTGGYGLGMVRLNRPGPEVFGHSGGGFGFKSDMYWYPALGIGGLVLTNSTEHGLQQNLVFKILDIFVNIMHPEPQKQAPAAASGGKQTTAQWPDPNQDLTRDNQKRLSRFQQNVSPERKAVWAHYVGDYAYQLWGKPIDILSVRFRDGNLTMNGQPLYEARPGLLFADNGEVLDFRNETPLWRSIALRRVVTPLWQRGFWGMSILFFPLGLVAWAAVGTFGRIRGRVRAKLQFKWLARFFLFLAMINAGVCTLFSAIVYFFPFLIIGGWPDPTDIMPGLIKAARLIPTVIALLSGIMVVISIGISKSPSWPVFFQRRYALLSFGAVLFVVLLASWQVLKIT